jgi:hypothetical protein
VRSIFARKGDRVAVTEAHIPEGIHFRLTEQDALVLGVISPDQATRYRPAIDAMGGAAQAWNTAANEVERALGHLDQLRRATAAQKRHEPADARRGGGTLTTLPTDEQLAAAREDLNHEHAILNQLTHELAQRRHTPQRAIREPRNHRGAR